jgi:CDP-diacylglycerol--glycerol-3-phosphate 3-phosphatidyltransferase
VENFRIQVERLIRQALGPVIQFLVRRQVSPNAVSITGFLVTIVAVGLFIGGAPVVAGLIFLLGSLLDVLDGELARASNRVTPFGAVIDSLLDRISEGALLIAIAWYFADRGEVAGVVITAAGMLGSVSTSYVRARAEAVGTTCAVGWITRPERIIILTVGMISGQIFAAIVILFVLATLTVIQRTAHVHRLVREQNLPSVDESDSSH